MNVASTDTAETACKKRKRTTHSSPPVCVGREQEAADIVRKYEDLSPYCHFKFDALVITQDAERFGINEMQASQMTLEILLRKLDEPSLLHVMHYLLFKLCAMDAKYTQVPPELRQRSIMINKFLASYKVAFHATVFFKTIGAPEKLLVVKSKRMIRVIDEMRGDVIAGKLHGARKGYGLHLSIHEFMDALDQWKAQDDTKHLNRLKCTLSALLCAEKGLPNNDADTPALREAFRLHQDSILCKSLSIAGVRGVAEMQDVWKNVMGVKCNEERLEFATKDAVHGVDYTCTTDVCQQAPMSREEVTHEILVNPKFNGNSVGPGGHVKSAVAKVLDDAFWVSLQDDLLLTAPVYVRCFAVLREIKNHLDGLQFPALRGSTFPSFNMDDTKNELVGDDQMPAWSWYTEVLRCISDGIHDAYAGHMAPKNLNFLTRASAETALQTMKSKLDANMVNLEAVTCNKESQASGFIQALRTLNNLDLDLHQAILNAIFAHKALVGNVGGLDRLHSLANQKIKDGTLKLAFTQEYLRKAIDNQVVAGIVARNDLTNNGARTTASYNAIVQEMVKLSLMGCESNGFPETLQFDQARFKHLKNRLEILTFVAAALGIVSMASMAFANKSETLQKIGHAMIDSPLRSGDFDGRIQVICQNYPSEWSIDLSNHVTKSLEAHLSLDSHAFKLVSKRMASVVDKAFHSKETKILDEMPPYALEIIGGELQEHVTTIRAVLGVNLHVYADHYNKIIRELATERP